MRRDRLLQALRDAPTDEPLEVLVTDLSKLESGDLPDEVEIQAISKRTGSSVVLALNGVLTRGASGIVAYIDEDIWRKYSSPSLGPDNYAVLVREAVLQRERARGDVELVDTFDDGNVIGTRYRIALQRTNLRESLDEARQVQSEILEVAEAVAAGVEDLVAAATKRLRGWGERPLDEIVDRMRKGTAYEKGLALEELASRLFSTLPGFAALGRVSTETEEIDIRIQNASEDEVWRRESALLIAECKNWTTKCGKDEFVLFRSKLENRTGRVSCGFLISWNGFAETVTAEMLRGTKGDLLVVPLTGEDLRAAVRGDDFATRLKRAHSEAVLL